MEGFTLPKWDDVFVPDGSLLESFLRASLIYLAVLVLFRVALKRQRGSVGLGDLMLLLLCSEVVSQGMIGEFYSVPNAVVGLSTFIGWCFVTDWLSYKYKWAASLLESSPLQLLRDGRPIHENMRKEHINEDDLLSKIREKGYDDFSRLKAIFIEPEGDVSVVPLDGQRHPPTAPADAELNGDPSAPPDFDVAMKRFLDAAHRLHDAAVWHDERAAEHKRQAAEAREALKRFGVQPRALLHQSAEPANDHVGSNGAPSDPGAAGP